MAKQVRKHIDAWNPRYCVGCKYPFDSPGWQTDWSMSGELVWLCGKCKKENYQPMDWNGWGTGKSP